jgi:multidrug efflux system outer membrane protein
VARAAYFPSISLTGFLGSESVALHDLFTGPARTWRFAGDLTQPIWGWGRVSSQADVAGARGEQALQVYKAAVANAFRDTADALAEHAKARAVAEAETRRVVALTKTWELAKLRFDRGASSQLDVIDAERGLLLAELDRIAADRDLGFAVADFYRAAGGRTAPGN